MQSVTLKFKDGTTREVCTWYWKPVEGWFTIAGEDDDKKYWMSDLLSAVCHGERIAAGKIGEEDMLASARESRKWHFDRGECPSIDFPVNPEGGMCNVSVQNKQVKCKTCEREYVCTPMDDYYNSTTTTDGVCLTCLVQNRPIQ